MSNPQCVCVAVSGGVDSLCALLRVRHAGYRPLALHGIFYADETRKGAKEKSLELLRQACKKIAVELEIVDFRAVFYEKVILPFINSWLSGQTPNPCAICNREIKFAALMRHALAMGADYLATGHYARLAGNPYEPYFPPLIAKARDCRKDQSYFLSLVQPESLRNALFPLAGLEKAQCRKIVRDSDLKIPDPTESQDICFVPAADYGEFLMNKLPAGYGLPAPGPVYLRENSTKNKAYDSLPHIGEHQGLWRYTEGQRRGLNIPWKEPLYVLEKRGNALIVGARSLLGINGCTAGNLIWHVSSRQWPEIVRAKTRFSKNAAPARWKMLAGKLEIMFLEKQFPSAPGQLLTIYDDQDLVLAGGLIESLVSF